MIELGQYAFVAEHVEAYTSILALMKDEDDPQKHFPMLVRKANKILSVAWEKRIEIVFIHNGRMFAEFTPEQRQEIFMVTRQRPTISTFNHLKTAVGGLSFEHPIKADMLELIDQLTPLVLGVHDISTKKVYENAALREGKPVSH